jgi:phosphoribosylamine--glycine ligase
MLVSGGYPGEYESNLPITLPTVSPTSFLFHAGTGVNELGEIITKGGRVLAITSLDLNKKKAEEKSRVLADQIFFKNKYYRKDIGFDL